MASSQTIPPSAVAEDARLEASAERAGEQLARHRWHWTLDESNPERVALRAYARAVGRDVSQISRYAHGFAAWSVEDVANRPAISDAIARAGMAAERELATEAVAEVTGRTFTRAANDPELRREVRSVVEGARARAERKGTTTAEEIPGVAKFNEEMRQVERATQKRRAERHSLRYVEVSGKLGRARTFVQEGTAAAEGVEWAEDERELLLEQIDRLAALIGLTRSRIGGESGTDWDAAFARVTGEAE